MVRALDPTHGRLHTVVKILVLVLLLLAPLAPSPSHAQDLQIPGIPTDAPAKADALEPAQITSRQAAVAEEISRTEGAITTADPTEAAHLDHVLTRLREIASILDQQAELAKPPTESADAQTAAPAEFKPSIFALNTLLEARADSESGEGLKVRREALARAKERLSQADRARRKAREDFEKATGQAKSAAERTFELRKLDARLVKERVRFRTLDLHTAQAAAKSPSGDAGAEDAIARMRTQLAAGEGDSSEGFAQLTALEGNLRREREATERRLRTAELQLEAAEKRFARLSDPPADLLKEVDALTARRDAIRQEIALADAQLERLASQRQIWRDWDGLLRGAVAKTEYPVWVTKAEERIERLKDEALRRNGRVADLEKRLLKLDERLSELEPTARLRPVLEDQRDTLRRLEQAQRAEARELVADQQLTERFLEDVRGRDEHKTLMEYVSDSGRAARDLWNYEITTVDDEPITVGSLALALIFFGIGFWAARRGSVFVGRVALERFKLDVGGANALQSLSFYLLLVSFMLMALRAVNFPLTAFTVLGGALAIGIGFGSQNVMNNFISGLILMLERPVRARDVVEVDGNHGIIESIGARSTQIRATDGRHIVVPNSFFLESNVVNWTLSDDLIRAKVTVGVIYGSPTRLVEELIARVVETEERVIQTPKPIILFNEFGDNSLNFDVYFWVKARSPMEVMKVQSLIRFKIDDLFREHDLVIAFPQRDVHLDSVKPIEVRMIQAGESED